jgi:serine/threonine-protein kinase
MDLDPNARARRGVWWAAVVFVGIYAGFVAYVVTSSEGLPARVATHFNGAGRADGWMSRSAHVGWTVVGGLVVPAIVVGAMFMTRFVSDDSVNLPHKAYWLAEGRRAETMDYLLRHAIWLGCWVVMLFAGLQYLVVEANGRRPPGMSASVGWVIGTFAAGVIAWLVALARHFGRVPRT